MKKLFLTIVLFSVALLECFARDDIVVHDYTGAFDTTKIAHALAYVIDYDCATIQLDIYANDDDANALDVHVHTYRANYAVLGRDMYISPFSEILQDCLLDRNQTFFFQHNMSVNFFVTDETENGKIISSLVRKKDFTHPNVPSEDYIVIFKDKNGQEVQKKVKFSYGTFFNSVTKRWDNTYYFYYVAQKYDSIKDLPLPPDMPDDWRNK